MAFADRILSVLVLVMGIVILAMSRELEYHIDGVPGPGFMPFWIGAVLTGLAILIFVNSLRGAVKTEESPFSKKHMLLMLAVIGACLLVPIATKFLGLLISLGLLSGFLTWFYGLRKWQTVITVAVLVPAVLYLVFGLALDVRLPRGILGI